MPTADTVTDIHPDRIVHHYRYGRGRVLKVGTEVAGVLFDRDHPVARTVRLRDLTLEMPEKPVLRVVS